MYSLVSWGQSYEVTGKVIDSKTREPLAFVNIVVAGTRSGTSSDIDGNFKLTSGKPITRLMCSYVGYEQQEVSVTSSPLNIQLTRKNQQLREVRVFPTENPAHRIIRQAVKSKPRHHPDRYDAYTFQIYSKVIAASSSDSTLFGTDLKDQSSGALRDHVASHYLFLSESISERKYKKPGKIKETVIANRVSGLKEAPFAFLATDIQPFGFYDDWVMLGDKRFLNPISGGSWNKYLFLLEDTLYSGADTTFVISYRPRKGKNFESLEGVVSINTNGFALENIIAISHQAAMLDLVVQQQYRFYDSSGVWFPDQLNFDMELADLGVRLEGRSYLKEVDLRPELSFRDFDAVTIELADDASLQPDSVWEGSRADTLTAMEQNTYAFNDSVGESVDLDKRMRAVSSLIDGRIPVGFIDVDLSKILGYNLYEGFRLGAGIETNDRITRYASLAGYYAYGFRDEASKYGGELTIKARNKADMRWSVGYQNDVRSPGSVRYWKDRLEQNTTRLRDLFTDWMNTEERWYGAWETRAFRFAWLQGYVENTQTSVTNSYQFVDLESVPLTENTFRYTEAGIRLRYAFRETVVESFDRYVSLGTRYPIVWANYARGLDWFDGEWEYNKVNLKFYKQFQVRILGKFSILADAGWVDANLPAPLLFFGNGTYTTDLPVAVDNAFQTMRFFEFMADRYVQVFYAHTLFRWYTKYEEIRPEFIFTQNVAWGELAEEVPGFHQGIAYSDLSGGYYESGLQIDHLVRLKYLDAFYLGLGAGGYYRWGPYQFDETQDNLVFRLTTQFEF